MDLAVEVVVWGVAEQTRDQFLSTSGGSRHRVPWLPLPAFWPSSAPVADRGSAAGRQALPGHGGRSGELQVPERAAERPSAERLSRTLGYHRGAAAQPALSGSATGGIPPLPGEDEGNAQGTVVPPSSPALLSASDPPPASGLPSPF